MTIAANERALLRYRSLDHWRAVAALMVMVFHCFWALSSAGTGTPVMDALAHVASFGHLGVHLFFVISGYCIAASVHRAAATGGSARAFLVDRALRVYPPYWAALVAQVALILAAVPFSRAANPTPLPADPLHLLANLLLVEPYSGAQPAMIVTWTLTCELGFYVLVGLGFAAARRFPGLRRWTMLGIALALAPLAIPEGPVLLLLAYWPEFACGGLIYLARLEGARRNRVWRHLYLAAIPLLLLAHLAFATGDLSRHLPLAAGFALTLYFLSPFDEGVSRVRWLRWLGGTGAFSYSLYLIHVPVLLPLSNMVRRWADAAGAAMPFVVALMCASAVLAGFLFHRFCEAPLERGRHGIGRGLRPPAPAVIEGVGAGTP